MKKPCILFAGPMLGRYPGWVPNPAEALAPRLVEQGFSCSLVSSKRNRYLRLLDILFTIWNERAQIDILCLQIYSGPGFFVGDAAGFFAGMLGIPVVMVLHGGDLPVFMNRFPNWSKRVFRRANTLVTPSAFLAQAVLVHGFESVIIPNAIDINVYPFIQRNKAQPNLLWMRTFHDIYNPIMAVNTLAKLKQTHSQAQLTMSGQDKGFLDATHQQVCELGLNNSVRFVGFLDLEGKQREFAKHDIFLNTNSVDNMPVSVIEAAAFGIPIVATAVGGVPFLIHDGENGILVPDNDVSAMVNAVQQLLNEPALVEKFSRENRVFAEGLDWSVVLPQWEALIMDVFEESGFH